MNHLFKRFRRDIIGIIWLAIGIFLALALYSYMPSDPSLSSVGTQASVQNYCGYFGSFLADLLYMMLGFSSWVFVIGAFRLAYLSFSGNELAINKLRIVWAILLFITVSSLSSLYFPTWTSFDSKVHLGGMVGLMTAKGLKALFNFAGVAVILWTMSVVLLVFYTEKTLQDLFRWPLGCLKKVFTRETWEQSFLFMAETILRLRDLFLGAISPLGNLAGALAGSGSGVRRTRHEQLDPKPGGEKFFKIRTEDLVDEHPDQDDEYEEDDELEEVCEEEFGEIDEIESKPQMSLFKKKNKKRKLSVKAKVQRKVENWTLPQIDVLEDPPFSRQKVTDSEIKKKSALLTNKLAQFSVRGRVVGAKPGPAITMYEFRPEIDVKISKITDLADDLSLALSSESVRIIAPIPGRDVVGIETSNSFRETVYLKEVIAHDDFWDPEIVLPMAVGTEADGTTKVVDLRKMPHLMVAGSTGSGKSVFVVSVLVGLLFRHTPKTLKLILIDPKQVDLAVFNELPHLIMPPIRDTKKAVLALRWAIKEMDKRYRSMAKFGARGIEAFNKVVSELPKMEIERHTDFIENLEGAQRLEDYYYTEQPYIAIVVEEFGDLMAVDKANVEAAVVRLAQMARACGIHLILAMQSPRKDVVTGLIKTNIPGRFCFKVASKMDSRIILDESGGERLLTKGDMLFLAPGISKPARHLGPWLSDQEISELVKKWKSQGDPEYDILAMRALEGSGGGYEFGGELEDESEGYDERYDEILAFVSTQKTVSASMLQRKFRLGYPRAARMVEVFESEGVVGPASGSKPREVLVSELK